jgi:hypothetical protein
MTMRRHALRSRRPLVTVSFLSLMLSLFSLFFADHIGRSRLFTVGIGSAPNTYFIRRAAELGRGTFAEIGSEDQVLERMSALFAKLEKPVMVGQKASWPAGTQVETWPDPLPDLYAGEPVVLSAKVSSMNGELHFTPTVSSEETSGQAEPSYPLLPLTVIPKSDASPIASLKTPGAFDQRLVVLALLLTILSAVTLVMWRYHRRDYASPRRTGRRI